MRKIWRLSPVVLGFLSRSSSLLQSGVRRSSRRCPAVKRTMATNAQRGAGVAFRTASELGTWLSQHHDTATELDVRLYKVASGIPSVTWTECVVECLAWGWIDSRKKSLDAVSYLQRISPRRPKTSPWSQANVQHAEQLIAQGRMKPPGLAAVHAAKQDKRWEAAYAGPATTTIPEDFLAALEGDAARHGMM